MRDEVVIETNEKNRHLWDINETDGFKSFNVNGKSYDVNVKRAPTGHYETATLLMYIDLYIQQLIDDLEAQCIRRGVMSENCKLIANTPYVVQEIEYETGFYGINKPKGIVRSRTTSRPFRLDNEYRATYRLIMLDLRDRTGRFIPWDAGRKHTIKSTLLHELAHTMCNHITYRTEGNHQKDFHDCEKVLLELARNPSTKLSAIENTIKNLATTR